jgi:hypothetical protein
LEAETVAGLETEATPELLDSDTGMPELGAA